MNRSKSILLSFSTVLIILFSSISSTVLANNITTIQIISVNDFHGALTAADKDKNPGIERFATALKAIIAKFPNSSIFISAGDNFTGSALSNLLHGKPLTEIFKSLNITASAIGNHEFDWQLSLIPEWQKDMGAPLLSANIYYKKNNKPVDFALPYIIKDVDGIKVAFIGLTTQETALKTKPENVNQFDFKNPVEIAEKYVPIVKNEGADIVILLTHIGTHTDNNGNIIFENGAEGLPFINGVNGIITAHSHELVEGYVNNVPVVQAMFNGRALGILQFDVDTNSKKIVSSRVFVDQIFKSKLDYEKDPETSKILDKYVTQVSPILDKKIGVAVTELPHDRRALSPLGQYVTDIMRKSTGSDIAFENGGGIRAGIPKGDITMGRLYEIMPFDNLLSVFEMTGSQIKKVLEHGIDDESTGWVQFSGLKVTYANKAKEGEKLILVKLEDGSILDDNKTYTVVTNDFMAKGGDGFSAFLEANLISETVATRDEIVRDIETKKNINYKPKKVLEALDLNSNKDAYVVKKYDTLSKIGAKLKLEWDEIAKINNIKDPNRIYVDQVLILN